MSKHIGNQSNGGKHGDSHEHPVKRDDTDTSTEQESGADHKESAYPTDDFWPNTDRERSEKENELPEPEDKPGENRAHKDM